MADQNFVTCNIKKKPKQVPIGICALNCPKKDFTKCEAVLSGERIKQVEDFLADFDEEEKSDWNEKKGWVEGMTTEGETSEPEKDDEKPVKTTKKGAKVKPDKEDKTKESYLLIATENTPAIQMFTEKSEAEAVSDELVDEEVPHTCLAVSGVIYSKESDPNYVIIQNEKTPILCESKERLADLCEDNPGAKVYKLGAEVKVNVKIEVSEVDDE